MDNVPKRVALGLIDQAELVDLLKQMIAIPSRNPPGEEAAMAAFMAGKAQEWGLEAQLIDAPIPGRPQVVIRLPGTAKGPALVLNGHLDTVPEMEPSRWSYPPFEGTVVGNRLYGRGACDMKAGLAAAMCAAKALHDARIGLSGDLIIQGAMGEESGEPGTRYLLTEAGVKGDWAIVLEPTDLRVAIATRGVAWFHLLINGTAGHASRPSEAINPIYIANDIVRAVQQYNRALERRKHPLLGHPTATVTMFQSGTKDNIIPGSCLLSIDRRTIPGETAAQAEQELRALIDEMTLRGQIIDYDISLVSELGSAEIPESSQLVDVLTRNFAETLGRPASIWGTPYGSDMRNFINDAGMPAVNFGPGSIAQAHAFDEYVEISQVVDCAKALVAVAIDLLS